jgi:hypothetical protein
LVDQLILKPNIDVKKSQQNISTQTHFDKHEPSHHSCFHRPKPIYDQLSRTTPKMSRQMSVDDPLQQQISIQNMFDAIKVTFLFFIFNFRFFFLFFRQRKFTNQSKI